MNDTTKKLLLVILAGTAFGSSVVFARIALKEVDAYTVTVLRFGIAALFYALTLPLLRLKLPKMGRKYFDLAVVGFTSGLPLLLFYFALAYISSGMFSIMLATLPLFTAFIAHSLLKDEKLSMRLLIGLTISLAGVVYLILTRTSGLVGVFDIKGPIIALIGVLIAAFGSVYARSKLNDEHPFIVSTLQTAAAFIFVTAFVFALGKFDLPAVSGAGWFAIFYNGVIGSYVAFLLTFILIKRYGATAGALSGYVMPVVSGLLGAFLLGEIISLNLVIGAAVTLGGLFFFTKHQ